MLVSSRIRLHFRLDQIFKTNIRFEKQKLDQKHENISTTKILKCYFNIYLNVSQFLRKIITYLRIEYLKMLISENVRYLKMLVSENKD